MATPSRAEYLASVETASENVKSQGFEVQEVDVDAKARAEAAGVQGAWAIDYAEAMGNYEARSDVEPLAQRRAREAAAAFADQDFARKDDYYGGFDAPEEGSFGG